MHPPRLLATATLTALVLCLTPAAAQADHEQETTVTWPQGPVPVGTDAQVTVTATGLGTPDHWGRVTTRVLVSLGAGPSGHALARATLTPDSPVASLAVPTSSRGTADYVVTTDALSVDEERTIAVVGAPTVITGAVAPGRYRASTAGRQVAGTVSGTPGRLVQVEALAADGDWVPLAETHTAADTSYALETPTWWTGTHTLRVTAPGTDVEEPASTDPAEVTVERGYRPRSGSSHRFFSTTGTGVARWDPCDVIDYRINLQGAWSGAAADVRTAFDRVSEATGLRFRYAGATSFRYYDTRLPYVSAEAFPQNADFVLNWRPRSAVARFRAGAVGLGGSQTSGVVGTAHERSMGAVTLNSGWRPQGSRSSVRSQRLQLLMHEIGHTIGLDHVQDKRQIMFPVIQRGLSPEYATGDLLGLAALGAGGGCF